MSTTDQLRTDVVKNKLVTSGGTNSGGTLILVSTATRYALMSTTGQLRTDVVKKQPVTSGGTTSGATLISVSVIISAYLGCSVNGHDVNCTSPSRTERRSGPAVV